MPRICRVFGARARLIHSFGEVPEWLKGADCKSAGSGLRWFESTPHQFLFLACVVSFRSSTVVAQLVEQRIPNPQVGGSIPSDRASVPSCPGWSGRLCDVGIRMCTSIPMRATYRPRQRNNRDEFDVRRNHND